MTDKKPELSAAMKKKVEPKVFKKIPILGTSKEKPNPKYIVNKLRNMNYVDIAMMVGSDRAKAFSWVGVPIKSGGTRNNKNTGAAGMSATKARQAAINNDKKCI